LKIISIFALISNGYIQQEGLAGNEKIASGAIVALYPQSSIFKVLLDSGFGFRPPRNDDAPVSVQSSIRHGHVPQKV